MTVRRQLVNFGSNSTDFRVGPGALEELPRLLKNVVGAPKRALVVCDGLPDESMRRTVRRALIDSGFTVDELSEEALARKIDEILSRDEASLQALGQKARHYILTYKSPEHQCRRLVDLINQVTKQ